MAPMIPIYKMNENQLENSIRRMQRSRDNFDGVIEQMDKAYNDFVHNYNVLDAPIEEVNNEEDIIAVEFRGVEEWRRIKQWGS